MTTVIVLSAEYVGTIQSTVPGVQGEAASLEGWLVCNGAEISRSTYSELFAIMKPCGQGDGVSTFNLPNFPMEYRAGVPIKGVAICPSGQLGFPAAVLMSFDEDNNVHTRH
jgi:microcystin-dependent protein